MSRIFWGARTFEVFSPHEAYEVMDKIARVTLGTFEGRPISETGYWVDKDSPHDLGENSIIFDIRGARNGISYAETDNPTLFGREAI